MKNYLLIILIMQVAWLFAGELPDRVRYAYETDNFRLIHSFDWQNLKNSPDDLLLDHFSEDANTYGYLALVDKQTGLERFAIPVNPLSNLWISPDGKYIVALSEYKLLNPVQILIIDAINGKAVYRKTISGTYIKLSRQSYNEFLKNFPDCKIPDMYITYESDDILLHLMYAHLKCIISNKESYDFLSEHWVSSYLPEYAKQMSVNYYFWYNSMNPNIRFNYDESGKPKELLVNGKDGKDLIFKISEDFTPCR